MKKIIYKYIYIYIYEKRKLKAKKQKQKKKQVNRYPTGCTNTIVVGSRTSSSTALGPLLSQHIFFAGRYTSCPPLPPNKASTDCHNRLFVATTKRRLHHWQHPTTSYLLILLSSATPDPRRPQDTRIHHYLHHRRTVQSL